MSVLPIVERELRVAARRRGTYISRCIAALIAIVVGGWMSVMMFMEAPANLATALFGVLGGFSVLYAAVSGAHYTADSISSEKREGTLGLLFLTDLGGFDVVLGKLTASSLNCLYGLLGVIPVMAIPLLIGGVEAKEFWRMSLLVLNTLFMSLSLGIFASSVGRSAKNCSGLTVLGMLFFALVLPLFGRWLSWKLEWTFANWLAVASPAFAFPQVFGSSYRLAPHGFWVTMGVMHGLTWLFLIGASIIVPRSWQDRQRSATKGFWGKLQQWKYGNDSTRPAFRKRLLDVNPVLWLSSREKHKPLLVWLVLAAVCCGWLAGLIKFKRDWLEAPVCVITVMALTAIMKVWVAGEASRQLAEDKHSGALELLLSTPLTVKQIAEGQRLALMRQFFGPVVVVVALQLIMTSIAFRAERNSSDSEIWPVLGFCSIVMLLADLAAIYWVALWAGIKARSPQKASEYSVLAILVVPWVLFAGFIMLLAIASRSGGPDPNWQTITALWFFLGIGVDLAFGAACKERFMSGFREVASSRFQTSKAQSSR